MATRDKPNNYFAWYNDDDRIAIVERQTSTTDSKGVVAGEYDTYLSDGNLSGTITGVTRSDTTATYTASAAHGLVDDDTVTISGTTDYNDDKLASQVVDVQSSTTFNMTLTAGAGSTESGLTATFTSLFVDEGIRMTIHSKYEDADALTDDLQDDCGLDSMMHPAVLDYVRARVLEDMGQLQEASYFRAKYEKGIATKPTRRSGVRFLSVPRI